MSITLELTEAQVALLRCTLLTASIDALHYGQTSRDARERAALEAEWNGLRELRQQVTDAQQVARQAARVAA